MAGETLIACSLAWLIIWCALGFIPGLQHTKWIESMISVSQEGNLGKYWITYDNFRKVITAHAHTICFAAVSFLIGLAMIVDVIGFSSEFQLGVAIWMFVGVVLAGIGTRFRNSPTIAIGSTLFLTALITCFVGIFI